jgi:hypothetical protein
VVDWCTVQARRSNCKLIIHADNSQTRVATMTQQFLEQNAMKRAPHPAYSPDLAPSIKISSPIADNAELDLI